MEYECYGEMMTAQLVEGGSSKPVTNENRREYVDLYTKWALEDSISKQFEGGHHFTHSLSRLL